MSCRFVFWDVQHGSACYVETPNKTRIAVDLGTGSYKGTDATFSPLLHLKTKYGVPQLDAVIITHPHTDHIDDIFNFEALSPRVFWRPRHLTEADIRAGNRPGDKPKIDKYLDVNSRWIYPVLSDPSVPANNGDVDVRIFGSTQAATSNLNNHSLVVVFSYAGSRILIPGDNEPPSWEELLQKEDFRQAIKDTDILVAPHHGRESGYSGDLFTFAGKPRLTIISDGRFLDTSCTPRYSAMTRGWTVHKRSGGDEERFCVTTRNDGVVVVELGRRSNGNRYIDVKVD